MEGGDGCGCRGVTWTFVCAPKTPFSSAFRSHVSPRDLLVQAYKDNVPPGSVLQHRADRERILCRRAARTAREKKRRKKKGKRRRENKRSGEGMGGGEKERERYAPRRVITSPQRRRYDARAASYRRVDTR